MLDREHMSILEILYQTRNCQLAYLSEMLDLRCDNPRSGKRNLTGDSWITDLHGGEANGHHAIEKLCLNDLEKATIVNSKTIFDLMSPFASPRAGGNTNECNCA